MNSSLVSGFDSHLTYVYSNLLFEPNCNTDLKIQVLQCETLPTLTHTSKHGSGTYAFTIKTVINRPNA